MAYKQFITRLKNFVANSEMFARPSKQIMGSWYLNEYFIDQNKELKNVKEESLKTNQQFWKLTFAGENRAVHNLHIDVPILNNIENGEWSIHKNYLSFHHPEDFRRTIEFQFAIDKGVLKILKKNLKGEIEFFGFFKKDE